MKIRLSLSALALGAALCQQGYAQETPTPLHRDAGTSAKITVHLGLPHEHQELPAQLKKLASGVGWEFSPNTQTAKRLQDIGIKTIRCINVDVIDGQYQTDGSYKFPETPTKLAKHLETCVQIGASPHIVMGLTVPKELQVPSNEVKDRLAIMGQTPGKRPYWNGDWKKLTVYWKSMFRYVILERGFSNARFEIGNEPDIDGQFPRLIGNEGPMGSRALYSSYFNIYKSASQAATEFETENPGVRVQIGGPALAWSYSFRFGELNWIEAFLKDCAQSHLKLDFIGIHYYGNISSLHGEYPANYPSFSVMLDKTKVWRDETYPGMPIVFTEWGPSYHVNGKPESMVNANQVGAAWCLEFLSTLLKSGIKESLFLVTTDLQRKTDTPTGENVWGWCSFFVNPNVFGKAWPKPPYHVFTLISRLQKNAVRITGLPSDVRAIATMDKSVKKVAILFWNYRAVIPEMEPAVDKSQPVSLTVNLSESGNFFENESKPLKVQCFEISEHRSNALNQYLAEQRITDSSELQKVDEWTLAPAQTEVRFQLPSSGVSLLIWEVQE